MKEKVAREERYNKQKPFRRGIIKTISVQLQREKEKQKKNARPRRTRHPAHFAVQ
jgi:hypothetical protein